MMPPVTVLKQITHYCEHDSLVLSPEELEVITANARRAVRPIAKGITAVLRPVAIGVEKRNNEAIYKAQQ